MDPSDENQAYLKQRFVQFLDTPHGQLNYDKVIEDLIQREERRLAVDLNALRAYDEVLATGLLREPAEFLLALREAVDEVGVSGGKRASAEWAPPTIEDDAFWDEAAKACE